MSFFIILLGSPFLHLVKLNQHLTEKEYKTVKFSPKIVIENKCEISPRNISMANFPLSFSVNCVSFTELL